MKTLILVTVFSIVSFSAFAQHDHSGHQKQDQQAKTDTTSKPIAASGTTEKQLMQLLSSYYNIKNALVTGDVTSAASNADVFLRTVNSIDYKVISEGNIHVLGKDAGRISSTKDLDKQRGYFSNFSTNMIAVARALKLSEQPVHVQYCPMKKASWLSSEKEIRNPYYGSSMLTCGEVTETL